MPRISLLYPLCSIGKTQLGPWQSADNKLLPTTPDSWLNNATDHSMKTKLLLLTLAALLSTLNGSAQDRPPADDWKPAPSNQAGKQYPQVNSEGRVKFRIVAPKAQSVGCSFRESSLFVKGEDGAWTGYTRPLDEGFHYYTINIDGAEVPDPNSHYFYGASR